MSVDSPFVIALRRCVDLLGGENSAARATGIPQPTLNRWLKGKTKRFPHDVPRKFEKATKRKVRAREFE